jgi:fatty-acyl-CoA synthase/long-chain acyl-CoA synthetase
MHLLEGYGLTESACVASLNPTDGERRVGSIGLRLPWQAMQAMFLDDDGAFVRAADVDEMGSICLSGPNVFAGYLNAEHNRGAWFDAPDADGAMRHWFNTGDLGRRDTDGFFWLTGRKKELIIRGGHNIDPKQIEEALAGHPAVALCAAVGRPDLYAGEVPVAYVQLREGQLATEAELLAHARLHISERAAVPKTITVVDALPLTAVGKTFKPALVLREVELAVRDAAAQCGASLADLVVEQEPKHGLVARYRARGEPEAIAALDLLLGRHIFRSQPLA